MSVLLSVLITYHNEGALLRECLDSFAAQEFPPNEILIHDDASNDPVERYLPPRFSGRVLHSSNVLGPARARNRLWQASRGRYVHFHDADDRVLPGWGAHLHAALSDDVEAVFTEVQSRGGSRLVSTSVLQLKEQLAELDLVQYCLQGALLTPSGTYRRRLVESLQGFRESLWQSEDFDFSIRMALRLLSDPVAYPFRVIPQPLVEIALRPQSRSRDKIQVWSDGLEVVKLLSDDIPKRYKNDLAEAAVRIGSMLFRLGAEERARQAFLLAQDIGSPRFADEGQVYRWIARSWGPEQAEKIGRFYRRLPLYWRRHARDLHRRNAA